MKNLFLYILLTFTFFYSKGQSLPHVEKNKVIENGKEFNIISITASSKENDVLKAEDFIRLNSWKTNTVRLLFDASVLESSEAPYTIQQKGFKWFDNYIELAKANNLKIILALNTPPGGLRPTDDRAYMWTNRGFRGRFKSIWIAIAEKYKTDNTVIAYELLANPLPSYRTQWKEIANIVTSQIRSKDKNHMIIFNRIDGAKTKYGNDKDLNFAKLNDKNVIYGFQFYNPTTFTTQNSPGGMKEAGKYPDNKKTEYPEDLTTEFNFTPKQKIVNGTREWYLYATEQYEYRDTNTICAKPVIVCNKIGNIGLVAFSNIFIREYKPSGEFSEEILTINPMDYEYSWKFNSTDGQGRIELDSDYGMEGTPTLKVMYVAANSQTFNNLARFKPKFGYYYNIESYVRPQKLKVESDCYIRLDFEKSSSDDTPHGRDKEYLVKTFEQLTKFGKDNEVPLMVTQFGTTVETLKKNKGGDLWVSDVVELCKSNKVHYSYYKYTGKYYSLYPKAKNTIKQEPFQGVFPVIK